MDLDFLNKHMDEVDVLSFPKPEKKPIFLYDFFAHEVHAQWKRQAVLKWASMFDITDYSEYHFRTNEVFRYQKFLATAYIGHVSMFVVPDMGTILTYMGGRPFLHLLEYADVDIVSVIDRLDSREIGRDVFKRIISAYFAACYGEYIAKFDWNPHRIKLTVHPDSTYIDSVNNIEGIKAYVSVDKLVGEYSQLHKDCGFDIIFALYERYGGLIRPATLTADGDDLLADIDFFGRYNHVFRYNIERYTRDDFFEDIKREIAVAIPLS